MLAKAIDPITSYIDRLCGIPGKWHPLAEARNAQEWGKIIHDNGVYRVYNDVYISLIVSGEPKILIEGNYALGIGLTLIKSISLNDPNCFSILEYYLSCQSL